MFDGQLFAFIASCILALTLRYGAGTWAHPAPVFAGAWTLFLAIPTFAVPGMVRFPVGAWLIVAAIVAVSVSVTLAIRTEDVTPRSVTSSSGLQVFVLVGAVSAAASALVTQRANGISFTSLDSIAYAARQLTEVRYDGTGYTPGIATVLLGLTYGSAVAAPFVAEQFRGVRRALWLVAPAAGAAMYAVMTTARAPFLISAAITMAAWLTVLTISSGGRPQIRLRTVLSLAIGGLAVLSIFSYVATSRRGGVALTTNEDIARAIAVYAGGSLPAFGTWMEDAPVLPQSFGAETFAGVSQFLLMDRSLGSARPDVTDIGGALQTNVYTAFRTLAEDFGLAGALLMLALFAIGAAAAYRRAVLHGSVLAAVFVIGWGAFTFFSQTTSVFGFTNVCFGFLVGAVLLKMFVQLPLSETAETDGLTEPVADDRRRAGLEPAPGASAGELSRRPAPRSASAGPR